jgi:arsenate reductase (thioredoxin)
VLFVCPHGAGKSRIAAAWFGANAPAGWAAITAGVSPQPAASAHAPRLLAGTAALVFLDLQRPRPISAVPDADLVVAIDCPAGAVAADVQWTLVHHEFDEQMAVELQGRVLDLVGRLEAGNGAGARG